MLATFLGTRWLCNFGLHVAFIGHRHLYNWSRCTVCSLVSCMSWSTCPAGNHLYRLTSPGQQKSSTEMWTHRAAAWRKICEERSESEIIFMNFSLVFFIGWQTFYFEFRVEKCKNTIINIITASELHRAQNSNKKAMNKQIKQWIKCIWVHNIHLHLHIHNNHLHLHIHNIHLHLHKSNYIALTPIQQKLITFYTKIKQ